MTAKGWNQTRVSEILGIEYPIIQGPLGGLSSQRLTAAVSNFGGLGSFGAHGLEPNAIEDVIAEIRSLTAKPFAMNLWVSMEDAGARTSDAAAFHRALSHLSPHIKALGGTQPAFAPYKPIRFEDQARVLLDTNVPAFSFIYGIPPKEILDEARKKGIVTLGTATTPDEAIALDQAGVEVVVAQAETRNYSRQKRRAVSAKTFAVVTTEFKSTHSTASCAPAPFGPWHAAHAGTPEAKLPPR
jgi:nitronate monooxygenase